VVLPPESGTFGLAVSVREEVRACELLIGFDQQWPRFERHGRNRCARAWTSSHGLDVRSHQRDNPDLRSRHLGWVL